MISKNNHIEFKGRTTQELDVGAAASFVVGAEFDLELGRTYTIDRPFFKRGIDASGETNIYSLVASPNLEDLVDQLVVLNTSNQLFRTTDLGKRLFKTFFFQ